MKTQNSEWPDFCKCGKEAHHHLFIDQEKTLYKDLCDACYSVWLANKDFDKVLISRGT